MLKKWQGIAEQVLRYADATGYQMEDHFDFELAASSWTQGNFCNSFKVLIINQNNAYCV